MEGRMSSYLVMCWRCGGKCEEGSSVEGRGSCHYWFVDTDQELGLGRSHECGFGHGELGTVLALGDFLAGEQT